VKPAALPHLHAPVSRRSAILRLIYAIDFGTAQGGAMECDAESGKAGIWSGPCSPCLIGSHC
jgi:hypothetical protein